MGQMIKFMAILVFVLVACTQEEPKKAYMELDFAVDQKLLGKRINLSNTVLWIQEPVGNRSLDSLDFITLHKKLASDTAAVIPLNLRYFSKSESGLIFMISELKKLSDTLIVMDDTFIEQLKYTFQTNSINRSRLLIDDIRTLQFITTSIDVVNIKLFLLSEGSATQVDYFIPPAQYEREVEKIESSIGSISQNNKKENT